jgi:hypothetical protein
MDNKPNTLVQIQGILNNRRDRLRDELTEVESQIRKLDSGYLNTEDVEVLINLVRRFDKGELVP